MSEPINLSDAAFWDDGLPHQKEAWAYLQANTNVGVLQKFADIYRTNIEPQVPTPERGIVTPDLMQRLTGFRADAFDDAFCDDANRLFRETQFYLHLEPMRMLMANLLHETANFVYMKEIASGWAYEGRSDLGNVNPGDGPRYKGTGVLQLTGRYNYQRFADDIGDPRVMEGCDYVANKYPFRSAKTWIEENDLLNVCLNRGFDACCKRINGGYNGLKDRKLKYALCQREMI